MPAPNTRAGGRRAPQEEVVRVGGEAAVLKHAKQVVVLPVDIPADLDRRFELQQSWLVDENFFALDNDELHLLVGQLHRGARLLVPHCQELLDDHVAHLIRHLRRRFPPARAGGLRGTRAGSSAGQQRAVALQAKGGCSPQVAGRDPAPREP